MKRFNFVAMAFALSCSLLATTSIANQVSFTFEQAIKIAQKNDPWLEGSRYKQKSLELLSYSANAQPDPTVSIAFANLPTDTFDISQEGMSQFKVGISQMFARGDTLRLKNKQLTLASEQQPLQREERENKLAVIVGSLWLDLFQAQESIKLIESNRSLFAQLSQLVEASYASGLGQARQHDIVRSQLELTRLEDKLNQLKLAQSSHQGMLVQWLNYSTNKAFDVKASSDFPSLTLLNKNLVMNNSSLNTEQLALWFSNHPSIRAMNKKVATTATEIELAEQKYQVQWGVNASYGFRGNDSMGNNRADLFSVGVVFDLPLFTENKQDNDVKSAIAKTQAIKTEKQLLLRQLMANFVSAKARLLTVNERTALYKDSLLPQIYDQAEASLTAYTNDDGDFSEVVRAKIAHLTAQLEFLAMNVQQQKIILEINYLMAGAKSQYKQELYND